MAIHLTLRQRQILALVGEGLHNKEVADRLGIAERTVKSHLTRAADNLQSANELAENERRNSSPLRTTAAVMALIAEEYGLIEPLTLDQHERLKFLEIYTRRRVAS